MNEYYSLDISTFPKSNRKITQGNNEYKLKEYVLSIQTHTIQLIFEELLSFLHSVQLAKTISYGRH